MLSRLNFIPEMWNFLYGYTIAGRKQYPLRPEFIESLWYNSQALRGYDQIHELAMNLLERIEKNCKTSCGYADILDVETLEKENSMQR